MSFDMEEDANNIAKAAQSEDSLKVLVEYGTQLRNINRKIENLEEDIKLLKTSRDDLEKGKIPDLMGRLKLTEFKMDDGYKITSGPFVQASLPKEPELREKALGWLRNHGHEDLIKRNIVVSFDKGMDKKAEQLAEFARSIGMDPEDKADIHHMTYTAFIKEQLKNGVAIDAEMMGAYVGQKAKVTPPKT